MANKVSGNTIIIRAGQGTLSFLCGEEYHQYPVKSGMSISANLREAFREQPYLQQPIAKAILKVTTPVVLIPKEDYLDTADFDADAMYSYVLTGHKGEVKIIKELPELEAVALFSVNSDLQMVVGDNSHDVEVENVMLPVWKHFYSNYYQMGQRRKMFCYFHDRQMDICSFEQRRLKYANVFDAQHAHDALYYMLFVWKQLGMNQTEDDLYVIGDMPHKDWLMERLKAYLSRVHEIDPKASLNRSPLAEIESMPFDLMV
ncbi:MAG: DUF3822 family protein [Prevotella sp.]|nr:DUF3822 family protein [Candidatus Prevotella equi]